MKNYIMFNCCCNKTHVKYIHNKLRELTKKYKPLHIIPKCLETNYIVDGSTSSIYLENTQLGEFIIKKIDLEHYENCAESISNILNEIIINNEIVHPNIIKMFGYAYDYENVYMFFEKGECDMFSARFAYNRIAYISMCIPMIAQISRAINYLSQFGILHRDIKLENIIYCNGTFKLCDFGLSTRKSSRGLCGTRGYIAPEVLFGTGASEKSEIWSLGMCGLYMLCNEQPETNSRTKSNIVASHFDKIEEIEMGIWANDIIKIIYRREYKIIDKMISIDPLRRPSLSELIKL